MSMLTKIKTDSETQRAEQKRLSDRKKHILIFIQRHLQDAGYLSAAAAVGKDTNLSLDSLNTADNMDLDVIFQEFESFYEMKFGKKPKLCSSVTTGSLAGAGAKKGYGYGILPAVGGGAGAAGGGSAGASGFDQQPHQGADIPAASVGGPSSKRRLSTRNAGPGSGLKPPQAPPVGGAVPGAKTSSGGPDADPTLGPAADSGDHGGGIEVVGQNAKSIAADGRAADNNFVDRVRKPLPLEYAYNSELRELATLVERDICVKNPNVRFDPDIVGLTRPKQLVKEAVILPMKYPTLFTGILSPWRGILLFGPPGTGKTMLAKAVATECQVTFFNVSASTIVSKWRGESEKLARVLFDLARHHAPSTIFIDELDSVMSARGGGDEHEGSRRLKTEILIQMDGLTAERENAPQVFLLAASNLPWDLDPAMLRRLEKRILVPLPCGDGRRALLETYLSGRVRWQKPNDAVPPNTETTYTNLLDVAALARRLDGWSGSDIRLLCKEIAMGPLRRCLTKLESGDSKSIAASNTGANGGGGLGEELVTPADVESALARVSPAPLTCDVEKYEEWNTAFGST